jgi:hypothetical protein
VRLPGTGTDSPIEQHDLSEFCTSELHAAKVGAYLAARRIFVTHTLRIRVRPDAYNSTLVLGDIVRVRLRRETEPGVVSHHDYLYEVERINKSLSGAVELDLMHYPIDANGRSIVALYVAGTTINGFEYPTGRGTFTCDVNNPDDEDPLPDVGGDLPDLPLNLPDDIDPDPDSIEWPSDVPDPATPVDSAPSGGINNPADPIDSVDDEDVGGGGTITYPTGVPGDRPLLPGDTLVYTPRCCPAKVNWYQKNCETGEILQLLYTETISEDDNCESRFEMVGELIEGVGGYCVQAFDCCADPSAPDGYGEENPGPTTPEVAGTTGNLYYPGAGQYAIRWQNSSIVYIDNSTAPSGIGFYLTNKDDACDDSSARLWITYVDQNGTTQDSVWAAGCVSANIDLEAELLVQFQFTGGFVTLYPPTN